MKRLLISTISAFALVSLTSLALAQQSTSELDQLFKDIDTKSTVAATTTPAVTTTTTTTKVMNAANVMID
jgi:hypothetical protein